MIVVLNNEATSRWHGPPPLTTQPPVSVTMAVLSLFPESESVKRCSRCREMKSVSEFGKPHWRKLARYCRPCESAYKREYYLRHQEKLKAAVRRRARENPEKKSASDKAYRAKNREKCSAKARAWAARNKEKRKEIWQRWYRANRAQADAATKKWILEHPHHVSERSRRLKASRKQAFVSWADRDRMAAFYAEAARLTAETGIPYEVDHIVPLTSKIVCGFHCEANLQVVPRAVNRSKLNRIWPDMP